MHRKYMIVLKCIGCNFKKYRRMCGYSRQEVADMIGVSPRTLAAYERAEREISTELTLKLAEVYKTPFKRLVDYKEVKEEFDV